jgi:hypothetical protein
VTTYFANMQLAIVTLFDIFFFTHKHCFPYFNVILSLFLNLKTLALSYAYHLCF